MTNLISQHPTENSRYRKMDDQEEDYEEDSISQNPQPSSQYSLSISSMTGKIPSKWELNPPTTEEELREALETLVYEEYEDPDFLELRDKDYYERLRLRRIYTSYFVQPLLFNAEIAIHSNTEKSESTFPFFARLPPELRVRIWQDAISIPRVVELNWRPTPDGNDNEHRISLNNKSPPPLLWTCRESRHEVIKAYTNSKGFPAPQWLRFDRDIFHLKSASFSSEYTKMDWNDGVIRQWTPGDRRTRAATTDKWLGRPELFEKLRVLAVNMELLGTLRDDFECVIRHFFPQLLVLILLVNDANMKAYRSRHVRGQVSYNYQMISHLVNPAFCHDFVQASTGPFTTSITDSHYAEEIRMKTEYHLESEAELYENYHAPRVVVMSCSVSSKIRTSPFVAI